MKKILREVHKIIDEDDGSVNEAVLMPYKLGLKNKLEKLARVDEEILEDLCENEDVPDEDLAVETEEADKWQQDITTALWKIDKSLAKQPGAAMTRSPCRQHRMLPSTPSPSSEREQRQATSKAARLPKLEMKRFDGNICEWQEFWDCFESAADNDQNLAPVLKLNYLKGLLDGQAKATIAGLESTSTNYSEAVDLLRDRFGKKSVIQRAHTNGLRNLLPVTHEDDVSSLRKFYDTVEIHYRGLRALGVDEAVYSTIVVPDLIEKLPRNFQLTIIRGTDHLEWNVRDLLIALKRELELREQVSAKSNTEKDAKKKPLTQRSTASTLFTGRDGQCPFCLGSHAAKDCKKVKAVKDRKNKLKRYSRCFKCLKKGHRFSDCYASIKCESCNSENHHSALCEGTEEEKGPNKGVGGSVVSPMHVGLAGEHVALQTAQALVQGGSECRVRVLFDAGSQKSFVTSRVKELSNPVVRRKEWLQLNTFGNSSEQGGLREVVEIKLCSISGGNCIVMEAYVVPHISSVRNAHLELAKKDYPHLQGLYLSDVSKFQEELEIEVLIGADYLWQFQQGCIIRGKSDEPVAIQTSLGWVLSGPLKGKLDQSALTTAKVNMVSVSPGKGKEAEVQKLWDLETLGIRPEDDVQVSFNDEIVFNGVRYSVRLPWKVGHEVLPTNYSNSVSRLKSLLGKLRKEPEVLNECESIIKEQLDLGIIEKVVSLEPESDKIHYLPHRPVVRQSAETTKVRLVYDASSKSGKDGVSLNDCLHTGPSLNPLLYNILLRFRLNGIAMTSDIEKAFLNIEVDKRDRDCLRFLWPEDPYNMETAYEVYRFSRVCFGVRASPFLLNGTLRYHLNSYQECDPEFVQQMIDSLYVDDMVVSTDSVESAYTLYEKARDRLAKGGFKLRKWVTNDEKLTSMIQSREEETFRNEKTEQENDISYAKTTLGFDDKAPHHKVLGMDWNYLNDTVLFDFEPILQKAEGLKPTKRNILSLLAGVFDPLGMISPIQVSMKLLFQQLCSQNVDWDEEVTGAHRKTWDKWLKDLKSAAYVEIDRNIFKERKESEGKLECSLHGFCDASKTAYCAMVYAVYKNGEDVQVSLLTSKTRIAPLKSMTIPRLELMAARILAQQMKSVREAIESYAKITNCFFWSDSMTALQWIQNKGEWKQFVRTRVNEILSLTNKEQWKHCPGEMNPADLGSRGVLATQLKESVLWWEGPEFLRKPQADWPKLSRLENDESVEAERKVSSLSVSVNKPQGIGSIIELNKHSNLLKLLRVTALVVRFTRNVRAKQRGESRTIGAFGRNELLEAEALWIKFAQNDLRQQDNYRQVVNQLRLIEKNGILRCQGRLGQSDLDTETVTPILLPREHKLTEMFINDYHGYVHHSGVRATLAELRTRFWITRGRQAVKKVLNKCVVCKKHQGKSYDGPMIADLPDFRVKKAEPFSNVGLDFAGPLWIKSSHNEMIKCFISLFTCCVTRAVHLELVEDMGVQTFIRCFKRFTARRGVPVLVVSDNAQTFKAMDRHLLKLYNHPEVRAEFEKKKVEWRFILERASHWAGFYERLVGSTKRCLKKVLGNARLSYDEMHTMLVEVECTLNARPLTYVYNDVELEVITPSHLLHGRNIKSFPDYPLEDEDYKDIDVGARYRYLTTKLAHYWSRWRNEYLVNLREQHLNKSKPGSKFVQIGDIVLIGDDSKKRNQWKLGVVQELVPGKDGEVRGAKVRVASKGKTSVWARPVQKLFPIEVKSENEGRIAMLDDNHAEPARDPAPIAVSRPKRASALDARWKTRGMLDS